MPPGVPPAASVALIKLLLLCSLCLAVYQELRDSGFEANSTTYNALISAYGKLGQLDRVLEVYNDMVWRGLDRRCVVTDPGVSC